MTMKKNILLGSLLLLITLWSCLPETKYPDYFYHPGMYVKGRWTLKHVIIHLNDTLTGSKYFPAELRFDVENVGTPTTYSHTCATCTHKPNFGDALDSGRWEIVEGGGYSGSIDLVYNDNKKRRLHFNVYTETDQAYWLVIRSRNTDDDTEYTFVYRER